MNESLLAKLYAVILLYIAMNYFDIFTYFRKKKDQNPVEILTVSKPLWMYLLVGIGAGIFAGLFGKGGGIVIVPLLIGVFHYDPKAVAATSLAALQLPVGLPSVVIYANNGHLNIIFAGLIALGILAGTLLGSKLGVKLPSAIFKKVFAVFLLFVAVYMFTKHI